MMPVTLALVALLAAAFAQPVPPVSAPATTSQFDAARALADAATLSSRFPHRIVGSPAGARARAWIVERFTQLGLTVETLPFTVTVASEVLEGAQVWATARATARTASPGAPEDILLVTAHYDVPQARVTGAADSAAGVGAMLELARLFAEEPHARTLVFVASDSAMYGPAWGTQRFIEQFEARGRVVAVLELGGVSARAAPSIHLSAVGLRRGYTPLWMRQTALESIAAAGVEARDAAGLQEYLQRAFPVAVADYAVYLRAGIPALRLDGAAQESLARYGRVAETWLRAVDALDPLPANASQSFRLDRTRHLSGDVIDYLQILLFAPLFLATLMAWQKDRPRLDELQPEFTAFLGLVITGLDGYAIAYSLVALRLLPAYEMFPATPGDPFLLYPTWWAALVVYGTVALFGWLIFRPYRGWGRLADILQIPYRRLTLLLILSALVIAVWFLNGFTASALLGPAAYVWLLIEPRRGGRGKALNLALALAGLVPFAICVHRFAPAAAFGPAWWFLPLGAAYGYFPLLGVVACICGLALLLRFARLGLRDPEVAERR
jgi:hypothetical protein